MCFFREKSSVYFQLFHFLALLLSYLNFQFHYFYPNTFFPIHHFIPSYFGCCLPIPCLFFSNSPTLAVHCSPFISLVLPGLISSAGPPLLDLFQHWLGWHASALGVSSYFLLLNLFVTFTGPISSAGPPLLDLFQHWLGWPVPVLGVSSHFLPLNWF